MITDQAVKDLIASILDVNNDRLVLSGISVGTSDANGSSTDRAALEDPLGGIADIGNTTTNLVYPFDLDITAILPANHLGADATIKEIGIWYTINGVQKLFARAVDPDGIDADDSNATPIRYNYVLV